MADYLEAFSTDEKQILDAVFSNHDRQVFVLKNLGEEVAAALFARYSRTARSLRRVFLDEFAAGFTPSGTERSRAGEGSARRLMDRVIGEYGDDSVSQLGVLHIAIEQVSTVLARQIEWGRLMAYLEQSTRYVPLDTLLPNGHPRAVVPEELSGDLLDEYSSVIAAQFELYGETRRRVRNQLLGGRSLPKGAEARAIEAASLDVARGELPMSTITNLGVVANAQSLEYLVLRLRAASSAEAHRIAALLSAELAGAIPSLTSWLDRPDRGGAWEEYLSRTYGRARENARELAPPNRHSRSDGATVVALSSFDPNAEIRVAAGILFEHTDLPFAECMDRASRISDNDLDDLFRNYTGDRLNRRHKPGRALELAEYTFEIVTDYGTFRDLARHRILTLLVQQSYVLFRTLDEPLLAELGLGEAANSLHDRAFQIAARLRDAFGEELGRYPLPLRTKVRFVVKANARELLHLCELRSQPQGHPTYRAVAIAIHRAIADAGHRRIAAVMQFVDSGEYELGRLFAESRLSDNRERI